MSPARVVSGLLALALLAVGIGQLRTATLSTHQRQPADSELTVELSSSTHGGEPGQTLAEMTEALLLVCRLEVTTDPIGPLRSIADDHFAMTFRPGLDQTDQRQFRGCIEDWQIDHLQVDVISMTAAGD